MDRIFAKFLEKQWAAGMELAGSSDLLRLKGLRTTDGPAQHFIARFYCKGLVKNANGEVVTRDRWDIGIFFPDDYLRRANTFEVLSWLNPRNVFHPNIQVPAICLGERFFRPGLPLVEILFQVHGLITYRRWASHVSLNVEAGMWAVNNQGRFPVDDRPLKRRKLEIEVEALGVEGGSREIG